MERQKEKVKTAVAIAYEPGEEAPKILATGKGLIAERIIEKAKEEVRTNSKLDLDNGEIYSVETGETIGEV